MSFGGFFRGKRLVVTGVAGAKGVWLALALIEAGADVVGIDIRAPSASPHFAASGLGAHIAYVRGDVADLNTVQRVVAGADAVFHLAAVSLVHVAEQDPLEAYRTNVLGTVTVLEAFRRARRPKYLVIATTDKVYRPQGDRPPVETDPLYFAPGPYPVSKICVEHIARDYRQSYFARGDKRVGVGRAGNVIAGGDFCSSRAYPGAGRLFVDCFDALARGETPVVRNPGGRRPYLYVLDAVAGYMALMSRLDRDDVDGEAFNFGPLEPHGASNADLASRICRAWGDAGAWRPGEPRPEPHDVLSLDWTKAGRLLDWRPAYDLNEAVERTAAWYRAWHASNPAQRERRVAAFDQEEVRRYRRRAASLGIGWAVGA